MSTQLTAGNTLANRLAIVPVEREDSVGVAANQKHGCGYCGRSLSLLQRISGARFCCAGHEELVRRRRVEQMGRLLKAADITTNLGRSQTFQSIAPALCEGTALRPRPGYGFCRTEAPFLPKGIFIKRPNCVAAAFGPQSLAVPAQGPSSPRSASLELLVKAAVTLNPNCMGLSIDVDDWHAGRERRRTS